LHAILDTASRSLFAAPADLLPAADPAAGGTDAANVAVAAAISSQLARLLNGLLRMVEINRMTAP
jgi:hypothetical protein